MSVAGDARTVGTRRVLGNQNLGFSEWFTCDHRDSESHDVTGIFIGFYFFRTVPQFGNSIWASSPK